VESVISASLLSRFKTERRGIFGEGLFDETTADNIFYGAVAVMGVAILAPLQTAFAIT
jgi:hypothetical protein